MTKPSLEELKAATQSFHFTLPNMSHVSQSEHDKLRLMLAEVLAQNRYIIGLLESITENEDKS